MDMVTWTDPDPLTEAVPARAEYDWDAWTNGKVWTLREGEDFDVSPAVMRGYIYSRARRLGKATQTCTLEDGGIQFQFRDAGDPATRLPGAPRRGRPAEGVSPYASASAQRFLAGEVAPLTGESAPTLQEEIARRKAYKAGLQHG